MSSPPAGFKTVPGERNAIQGFDWTWPASLRCPRLAPDRRQNSLTHVFVEPQGGVTHDFFYPGVALLTFLGGQNASLMHFGAALDDSLACFLAAWGHVFDALAMPVKTVKSNAPASEFEGHLVRPFRIALKPVAENSCQI